MSEAVDFRNAILGNPPDPTHEPDRGETVAAFEALFDRVMGLTLGFTSYDTVADLPAVTVSDNGTMARVTEDPTATNNTFWVVVAGAWQIDTGLVSFLQSYVDDAEAAQIAAENAADEAVTGSTVDVLKISSDLAVVDSPAYRTTAGRMKRLGQCNWAAVVENEARRYTGNNNAVEGVIFDPGETYDRAADFSVAPADSNAVTYATTFGDAAVAVSQIEGHSETDIYGSTGGLVRWESGSSANGELRFPNMTTAVAIGDIVRQQFIIGVITPPSSDVNARIRHNVSGGGISGDGRFNVKADGTIEENTTGSSKAKVEFFDEAADGTKFYSVCFTSAAATGAGTLQPGLRVGSGAVLLVMTWHGLNPTLTDPVYTPVAAPGAYGADRISLGVSDPISVEWSSLKVGKTRVADGDLTPPISAGSPIYPIETSIKVEPSFEAQNYDYHLPGPRMRRLFEDSGIVDLRLGPGFYGIPLEFDDATNVRLRGAYDAPAQWPILRSLRTRTGGNITEVNLDRLAFWLRTPPNDNTGSTLQATSIVTLENNADQITLGDLLAVGCGYEWSQHQTAPGSTPLPADVHAYAGRFVLDLNVGGVLSAGDIKVRNCAYGLLARGPNTTDLDFRPNGFSVERASADFVQIAGDTTGVIFRPGHLVHHSSVAPIGRGWATEWEVEVDTGSGFQGLAASALSESDLPEYETFYLYGSVDGSGVITADPDERQSLVVLYFDYFSSLSAADTPGFQYAIMPREVIDTATGEALYKTQLVPDDTAWMNRVSNPSTDTPRIRIRHTAKASDPEGAGGAGAHGDHIQLLNGDWEFHCQNVLWLAKGQGYFVEAGTTVDFSSRGIYAFDSINALLLDGTGSYDISGIMVPIATDAYLTNGQKLIPEPDALAGTTVDFDGLFLGDNSIFANENVTDAGQPGTVTNPPTLVAVGRSDSFSETPARTDQPSISSGLYIDQFFLREQLTDDRLDATPDNLVVTSFGQEQLGFDVAGMLAEMREGSWGKFAELEAICEIGYPTHWGEVSNAAADDTVVPIADATGATVTFAGQTIVEGDPEEMFRIEGGQLMVEPAKREGGQVSVSLADYAEDNFGLILSDGSLVSIKVT